MQLYLKCIFVLQLFFVDVQLQDDPYEVDNIVDKIEDDGYPVELHSNVTTEDGYLLDLQRIPYGKNQEESSGRIPVLLVHGLLGSAQNWVAADFGLGYTLADEGYDVWMLNTRGTKYSRKHTKLHPKTDDSYWDYSWHEKGVYDLPAAINYITDVTGQARMFYVGHSEGGTEYFVMTSERPEFNARIRLMVSLSGLAYIGHTRQTLFSFASLKAPLLEIILRAFGRNSVSLPNIFIPVIGDLLCNVDIHKPLCTTILFSSGDYAFNEAQKLPIPPSNFVQNILQGSSYKEFNHYGQLIRSNQFRQFDYGPAINRRKYGSETPPAYDLKKVTSPVALYTSTGDRFTETSDNKRLSGDLPNVVLDYEIKDDSFHHFDYFWGTNVRPLYMNLTELFKQY